MTEVRRVEYTGFGITEADIAATPWQQARLWVDEAHERDRVHGDVPEPAALSVATVDRHGQPNVRTVLMRIFSPSGPGFLTNLESVKGGELADNARVAASLTWPSMFRAIRFRGSAVELDRDAVAEYFHSRPWGSRISAWASEQSRPAGNRDELEAAYARYAAEYPDTGSPSDVPVPPFWGGYRIHADEIEFWGGRRNRLHDRLVFSRASKGELDDAAAWTLSRRQP